MLTCGHVDMLDRLDMLDMLTCDMWTCLTCLTCLTCGHLRTWTCWDNAPVRESRPAGCWASRLNWSDLLYRMTVSSPKWPGGAGTCSGSGWVSMLNWPDVLYRMTVSGPGRPGGAGTMDMFDMAPALAVLTGRGRVDVVTWAGGHVDRMTC